jgi:hypothetical protein
MRQGLPKAARQSVNSYTLYVMSISLGVLGILFLGAVLATHAKDYITAASIFFVAAAAVFAAAAKFQADERDRAFRFLTENVNSKELMSSMGYVGRVLSKNPQITMEDACRIYLSSDSRDKDFLRHILIVYNFFEEMAIAINNNQVNELILRHYYIGSLCRFAEGTQIFLPIIRNFPVAIAGHPSGGRARPDIFVFAQWLFERWNPHYRQYFANERNEYASSGWTG